MLDSFDSISILSSLLAFKLASGRKGVHEQFVLWLPRFLQIGLPPPSLGDALHSKQSRASVKWTAQ